MSNDNCSDDIFMSAETSMSNSNRIFYDDKETNLSTETDDEFYMKEDNTYDIDDKNGDGNKLAKLYLDKIKNK